MGISFVSVSSVVLCSFMLLCVFIIFVIDIQIAISDMLWVFIGISVNSAKASGKVYTISSVNGLPRNGLTTITTEVTPLSSTNVMLSEIKSKNNYSRGKRKNPTEGGKGVKANGNNHANGATENRKM